MDVSFRGAGATTSAGAVDVFKGSIAESGQLEVSFWVYIDPSYAGMPVAFYHYGAQNDSQESTQIEISRNPDIADGWVRVAIDLTSDPWHRIELLGHDITYDELLIRPKDSHVKTSYDDGQCMLNNYPIEVCH